MSKIIIFDFLVSYTFVKPKKEIKIKIKAMNVVFYLSLFFLLYYSLVILDFNQGLLSYKN